MTILTSKGVFMPPFMLQTGQNTGTIRNDTSVKHLNPKTEEEKTRFDVWYIQYCFEKCLFGHLLNFTGCFFSGPAPKVSRIAKSQPKSWRCPYPTARCEVLTLTFTFLVGILPSSTLLGSEPVKKNHAVLSKYTIARIPTCSK